MPDGNTHFVCILSDGLQDGHTFPMAGLLAGQKAPGLKSFLPALLPAPLEELSQQNLMQALN